MGAAERRADRLREPRHGGGQHHRGGTLESGRPARPQTSRRAARRRRRPVPANPAATVAPPPPPKRRDGDRDRATARPACRAAAGRTPPANGPRDPAGAQPLVAGPPPGGPDGVVGVAPDAALISIRQSSVAFSPAHPTPQEAELHRKAGDVLSLAKAIRHAADLGAKVINVSLASCINAAAPVNQDALGAAMRYAAVEKDVVIVAAAGNKNDPMTPTAGRTRRSIRSTRTDPRDWAGVRTIVSPAWFSDYVLSVAAVTPEGQPMPDSINGPWVAVAAPGSRIMGLSSINGAAVNASPGHDPGTGNGFWGTSFSAAYVSGVAALVRAKFPNLTAHQVIRRITETAHNPAHGVDNQVGYGVVDPVAALTFDVAAGDPKPVEHLTHRAARAATAAGPGPAAPQRRAARRGRGAGGGRDPRRDRRDPTEDVVKARTVTRARPDAWRAVVGAEVVAIGARSPRLPPGPVRLVAGRGDHRGGVHRCWW